MPCVDLAAVLLELEKEMPELDIVKVDVKESKELRKAHGLMGVPTMFFMQDGELKERVQGGLSLDELKEKIAQHK